jgi:hypothetical protein
MSTTRRFSTGLIAGAVALIAVLTFAGPGFASAAAEPASACEATCLDASGFYGPSVPVAVDAASGRDLAEVVDATSSGPGATQMRLISAEAGTAVEVLEGEGEVATVRLLDGATAGRIGYIPVAWVSGS